MAQKLVKLQRDFCGVGRKGRIKLHEQNERLLAGRPKELGGLGIKNIVNFNITLVANGGRCRLMVDRGSLWGLVLKSKYGDVLDSPNVRQSQMESIWWRDIMDVCGDRRERSWFNDNITWKVGDGRRLCFLHHL